MSPPEEELAVHEIQGNVFPGFRTHYQVLLGVRFPPGDPQAARQWLRSLLPSISSMADVAGFRSERRRARQSADSAPPSRLLTNVAFDVKGLTTLVGDVSRIRDPRFRQGMGEWSGLGDPATDDHEGHPSRWKVGGVPANTPDAMLIIGCDDEQTLRDATTAAREAAVTAGLTAPSEWEQHGHVLEGEIEHFGFRDGISQPGPRGRLSAAEDDFLTRRSIDPADPRADRFGRPGQPLIWPGQFVFGYARQLANDAVLPGARSAGGYEWMDNGSYLVFRRLRQDVAAFRRFLDEQSAALRGEGFATMTRARLAALVVGRWPGGTALIRNPVGDDPDPAGDLYRDNHFGFADETAPVVVWDDLAQPPGFRTIPGAPEDSAGLVCPMFAHIRKVNPRDLGTDQGAAVRTLPRSVLRRGIPWGEPFPTTPEAQAQDDGQRGLLFLCYQTSIKDQYEFLSAKWMNDDIAPEAGRGPVVVRPGEPAFRGPGQDLLVGQAGTPRERYGMLVDPGQAPVRIATLDEWVIPTGGAYLFSPSMRALTAFGSEP